MSLSRLIFILTFFLIILFWYLVTAENMWQKSIAIMEDCFIISDCEEETAAVESLESENINNNNFDNDNNLAVKLADNFKNKLKLQLADISSNNISFSENKNNNNSLPPPSYLQQLGK